MDEIKVLVDRYKITDGKNHIYVMANRNRLIITPGDSVTKQTFNFTSSKSERVKSIANLMLKAVEVAEDLATSGGDNYVSSDYQE